MRVIDAHRVLGARPTGLESGSAEELLDDLDRLSIASAGVTPSWMLHADPRAADEFELARRRTFDDELRAADGRLTPVPVIIPALAGAGWPASPDDVVAPMVRVCPERHRFEMLGPTALAWWEALATRGVPIALDASECGLGAVAALASRLPQLSVLVLSPGYRELRRIVELLEHAPRLRVETGTLVGAGALEWLARAVGAHRLAFGTGAPAWDAAGPRFQLDHLELPARDVERIASGTWLELVGDPG
ncbi:amidohydrolase family protein [Agrococcus sp. Marseille-Q4369]|uniref:amidohydrolase family protein n=1 Tax=Agrococcus sp. Marseille-Q4369 TaxID=2810513 RepID=UPI001B8C2FE5|nr:amidohydrolase family protein [Agrococcus sp. Marseille-Q4369]QUW18113.1 amidohydrolase family protein [Agrococcus sp. Marseille-Q4369]